ncbi:hypothetical protein CR983_00490 [Candidatus Saccharibacteria bacterium]|nr:MAG: hypothetical protein CR983_00490 [Candidatus Saccharibacteria bacterium]
MKKTDIAMIILIACISVAIAMGVASSMPFLQYSEEEARVKTIEPISSDVTQPDERLFDADAINPTVKTVIGGQEKK